jgi:hypothetical protein
MERPEGCFLATHQLAFDTGSLSERETKMDQYNKLKFRVLSSFASGEWLKPMDVARRLNFFPSRSAWTYFKRLWSFGLLERRSLGKGTLVYRISDAGLARLRWLRSHQA